MMFYEWVLPPAVFAFSTLITPGPNNILIAAAGVNVGFKKSIPTILGVCFGFSTMLLCVSLGVGGIFKIVPALDAILKWASLLFMCYVAWGMVTASMRCAAAGQARAPGFKKLVLFQWINPKAWAMCTSAAAVFLPGQLPLLAESLALAGVFLLVSLPCQFLWGAGGAVLSNFLRASIIRLRVFNILMAAAMLAAFVPLVF